MRARLGLLLSFVLLPLAALAEPQIQNSLPQFETYVNEVLEKSSVPGASVGIVKDGQVFYARGFGVRDRENNLPVTENTLFAIGSTTKAMTATAAAMLQDDGRLSLRTPVVDYVTDFRLKDATATAQTNLVDLLTHRTGVPRHDLAWYGDATSDRAGFWGRLRYLEPSAGFRETWQYNNFMYMAAGYVIERTSGQTWEDFVRARIFQPLGMSASNFTVAATEAAADFARPHSFRNGSLVKVPMRNIGAMAPAGAVNSNVLDMAKWLQFNLDNGQSNGQALVKPETMAMVHRPQMVLPAAAPPFPEFSYPSYGMGWIRQTYRGHNLIWHTGGIDGFLTFVGFLPDDKLGVVVFQNADNAQIMLPLALRAIDEVLQLPSSDWFARIQALQVKPPEKTFERGHMVRPAEDYAGTFSHPAYGSAVVSVVNGQLTLSFKTLSLSLEHLNNGVFKLSSADSEDVKYMEPAYFRVNGEGAVCDLLLKLEPTVAPIVFTKL